MSYGLVQFRPAVPLYSLACPCLYLFHGHFVISGCTLSGPFPTGSRDRYHARFISLGVDILRASLHKTPKPDHLSLQLPSRQPAQRVVIICASDPGDEPVLKPNRLIIVTRDRLVVTPSWMI